jgi:hypothetical protein
MESVMQLAPSPGTEQAQAEVVGASQWGGPLAVLTQGLLLMRAAGSLDPPEMACAPACSQQQAAAAAHTPPGQAQRLAAAIAGGRGGPRRPAAPSSTVGIRGPHRCTQAPSSALQGAAMRCRGLRKQRRHTSQTHLVVASTAGVPTAVARARRAASCTVHKPEAEQRLGYPGVETQVLSVFATRDTPGFLRPHVRLPACTCASGLLGSREHRSPCCCSLLATAPPLPPAPPPPLLPTPAAVCAGRLRELPDLPLHSARPSSSMIMIMVRPTRCTICCLQGPSAGPAGGLAGAAVYAGGSACLAGSVCLDAAPASPSTLTAHLKMIACRG